MEPEKLRYAEGIKIDKLTVSDFHIWKQKIHLFITYREVNE